MEQDRLARLLVRLIHNEEYSPLAVIIMGFRRIRKKSVTNLDDGCKIPRLPSVDLTAEVGKLDGDKKGDLFVIEAAWDHGRPLAAIERCLESPLLKEAFRTGTTVLANEVLQRRKVVTATRPIQFRSDELDAISEPPSSVSSKYEGSEDDPTGWGWLSSV